MRFTALAFCIASLVANSGCTRNVPSVEDAAPPTRPAAELQKPTAIVGAPAVSVGEDENGKPVTTASLDAIRSELKDPDPGVRRSAVKSLGKVRWKLPDPVGAILVQALHDTDPDVRIEAARVASVSPERADDVAELLHDKDARVRLAAASTLAAVGKHQAEAAPALIAIAQEPHEPQRIEAIGVLGQLGAAQASIDALLLIAHDAEPKARAAALRSLARLDPASAKVQVALVKAVRDANVDVKLAALDGVGRDGIPTLIELLRHHVEKLRDAAARALGRIGPDAWSAGAELQRVAQSDPAERVRTAARTALKTIIPAPEFK